MSLHVPHTDWDAVCNFKKKLSECLYSSSEINLYNRAFFEGFDYGISYFVAFTDLKVIEILVKKPMLINELPARLDI